MKRFYSYGYPDKVLSQDGTRVKYMMFFDYDGKYRGGPSQMKEELYKVFPTKNGFHAIATFLGDANDKWFWYKRWEAKYSDTDYAIRNENVLAPRSKEEKEFILSLRPKAQFVRVVKYYRDKAVFESWENGI